jgi:hypothetical protein
LDRRCSRRAPCARLFFVRWRSLGRAFAAASLVSSAAIGCSAVPPLGSEFRSADTLAAAVLDAVGDKDRAALERLAIDEQEFRTHVWPDLPAARPERNLPFSYVWGDLHQKSVSQLLETLRRYGGARFHLRRVRFEGTTRYPRYVVHRAAVVDAVDASGVESSLRLCGSFLEKDGVWKVFSYVVDD